MIIKYNIIFILIKYYYYYFSICILILCYCVHTVLKKLELETAYSYIGNVFGVSGTAHLSELDSKKSIRY